MCYSNVFRGVVSRVVKNEEILKDLPRNDPKCWCKYEGGSIYNLLGEKK